MSIFSTQFCHELKAGLKNKVHLKKIIQDHQPKNLWTILGNHYFYLILWFKRVSIPYSILVTTICLLPFPKPITTRNIFFLLSVSTHRKYRMLCFMYAENRWRDQSLVLPGSHLPLWYRFHWKCGNFYECCLIETLRWRCSWTFCEAHWCTVCE